MHRIEKEISEGGLKIKKLRSEKKFVLPFNESDLLKNMTPKKALADIIALPLKSEY